MVITTEVGQLAGECHLWMDMLRAFRDKFQNQKSILPHLAADQTHRDVLIEIEHLDNQLHIQLINIHDLKQNIKKHMHKIGTGRLKKNGHIPDDILARHEFLYDEYQGLETTLHIIAREFDRFVKHIGRRRSE